MKRYMMIWLLAAGWAAMAVAQDTDSSLSRHDFFYAGQSKQRRMFMVKQGQVVWSYRDALKRGEISDAVLMKDGHIADEGRSHSGSSSVWHSRGDTR